MRKKYTIIQSQHYSVHVRIHEMQNKQMKQKMKAAENWVSQRCNIFSAKMAKNEFVREVAKTTKTKAIQNRAIKIHFIVMRRHKLDKLRITEKLERKRKKRRTEI